MRSAVLSIAMVLCAGCLTQQRLRSVPATAISVRAAVPDAPAPSKVTVKGRLLLRSSPTGPPTPASEFAAATGHDRVSVIVGSAPALVDGEGRFSVEVPGGEIIVERILLEGPVPARSIYFGGLRYTLHRDACVGTFELQQLSVAAAVTEPRPVRKVVNECPTGTYVPGLQHRAADLPVYEPRWISAATGLSAGVIYGLGYSAGPGYTLSYRHWGEPRPHLRHLSGCWGVALEFLPTTGHAALLLGGEAGEGLGWPFRFSLHLGVASQGLRTFETLLGIGFVAATPLSEVSLFVRGQGHLHDGGATTWSTVGGLQIAPAALLGKLL